ncbi:TonB-dependent receptor [bacterium]|nr:TonB-dependent receptor [bacterium]
MDDLITLTDVGGITQFRSGGRVTAKGAELSGLMTWPGGARLRASLSHQHLDGEDGRPANSPRWLGKLHYSTPLPWHGVSLGYELLYDGERRAMDGSSVDAYWLSNLILRGDRWAKGLEVSLGLYNLFNTRYAHPASDSNWQNSLEQDGRALRLRFDYRF